MFGSHKQTKAHLMDCVLYLVMTVRTMSSVSFS